MKIIHRDLTYIRFRAKSVCIGGGLRNSRVNINKWSTNSKNHFVIFMFDYHELLGSQYS